MFADLQAFITEWALFAGALLCFAAAVAAFIYVPVFGQWIAIVLVALGSALAAYSLGYSARGSLDNSGAIQAQLDEANRELTATQKITADFSANQAVAEANASKQQDKINVYEAKLKADPQNDGCGLSDDDLSSLSAIGPANTTISPSGFTGLRAVRPSTKTH